MLLILLEINNNPNDTDYVEGFELNCLNGRRPMGPDLTCHLRMICLDTTTSISMCKCRRDDVTNDNDIGDVDVAALLIV